MKKKCNCGFLEEIHGFISPSEYEQFKEYLDEKIKNSILIKVDSDANYNKGMLYGGTWYKCLNCNEIWRLVPPDFPFKGLWEKVDL